MKLQQFVRALLVFVAVADVTRSFLLVGGERFYIIGRNLNSFVVPRRALSDHAEREVFLATLRRLHSESS